MRFPKDNQTALISFYGDPGTGAVGRQLVKITPPFKMYYEGKPVKTISFHKKAAPALEAVLDKIWDYYERDQAMIDRLRISDYAGTYNPRKVRGSATKWSNHAYGAAIDLDASHNGFGTGKGTIPVPVIAAFKSEGFAWGGDYKGRTDPMHFEGCDRGEPARTFDQWLAALGGAPKKKERAKAAPPVIEEDFEDEPAAVPAPPVAAPAPAAPKPAPPIPDRTTVQGDPEIWHMQLRLDAMKYFPGELDGAWGGKTGGAISGFLNDRHSDLPAPTSVEAFREIQEALKEEISEAETEVPSFTRPIAPERAQATAQDIAPKVETVQATGWSRLLAKLGIGGSVGSLGIGSLSEQLGGVGSYLDPLVNLAKSMPWQLWVGLFSLVLVGLWLLSRRAEEATTQLYRDGRLS